MTEEPSAVVIPTVDLNEVAKQFTENHKNVTRRVVLCAGTGCVAGGALDVHREFLVQIERAGLPVAAELQHEKSTEPNTHYVSKSGCQGFCQMGPLVGIEPDGILYTKVKVEDVEEIVQKTLVEGKVVERLLYVDPNTGQMCLGPKEIPFYRQQQRTVLAACGHIDPGATSVSISVTAGTRRPCKSGPK